MKRIAIFCDGTWNRSDAAFPTNVVKLSLAARLQARSMAFSISPSDRPAAPNMPSMPARPAARTISTEVMPLAMAPAT